MSCTLDDELGMPLQAEESPEDLLLEDCEEPVDPGYPEEPESPRRRCRKCCDPCQVKSGCAAGGGTVEGQPCCKCVPQRVCMSLYDDADYGEGDGPIESVFGCLPGTSSPEGRSHYALFRLGPHSIDALVTIERDDYGDCRIWLTSEALGYDLTDYGDTRVSAYLGDARRATCENHEWTFDVDLTPVGGSDQGRLVMSAAPYTGRRPSPLRDLTGYARCWYRRICFTIDDGYEERQAWGCWDDYQRAWSGHVDHDGTWFIVYEDVEDPTVLSLLSAWGDGEQVTAACPRMSADWDLGYGVTASVRGDSLAACRDCQCWCECLCVTFTDPQGVRTRAVVCEDPYTGGWSVAFGDLEFGLSLDCIGCENPITMLVLDSPIEVIGDNRRSIICPDRIEATWGLRLSESETVAIEVTCATCGECPELGVPTTCCPDRLLPTTLTATVENIVGCGNADGATFPVSIEGPVTESCWVGFVDVDVPYLPNKCRIRFGLRCNGMEFRGSTSAAPCTTEMTIVGELLSCDPLEIVFERTVEDGPIRIGCCEAPGPESEIRVRITE